MMVSPPANLLLTPSMNVQAVLTFLLSLVLGCNLRAAPIHDAAEKGNVEGVRALLEADPTSLNTKNWKGETPIFIAAEYGHLEVFKLLLEKGALIDPEDVGPTTLLMIASRWGHPEVVKLLLG